MSSIISFITGKATYIFVGVILLLSLVVSSLYSQMIKKESKIAQLSLQLESLTKDNIMLEESIFQIKTLREKENEELERVRQRTKELQSSKEESLKEVDSVYKNKNNINSPLNPATVRLLNQVCESVRGEACPSAR